MSEGEKGLPRERGRPHPVTRWAFVGLRVPVRLLVDRASDRDAGGERGGLGLRGIGEILVEVPVPARRIVDARLTPAAAGDLALPQVDHRPLEVAGALLRLAENR